ncbi:MAG: helix-turn-helix transcriptional regulator [Candidatus Woesearchaeota archaeon]
MQRKLIHRRLEELLADLGMNVHGIARTVGIPETTLRHILERGNSRLSSIEKIAHGLGLIPIVLYRTDNGQVEDLGNEGLLHGEQIDNYVRRVFAKQRKARRLLQREVSEMTGTTSPQISSYETGRIIDPTLKTIGALSRTLGLVPGYLVERLKAQTVLETQTASDSENYFIEAIKAMEGYIVAPRNSIDLNDVKKVLGYVDRIAELHNALKTKVRSLSRS